MAFVIDRLVPPNIDGDIQAVFSGKTDAYMRSVEGMTSGLSMAFKAVSEVSTRINSTRAAWAVLSHATQEDEDRQIKAQIESARGFIAHVIISAEYPALLKIKVELE